MFKLFIVDDEIDRLQAIKILIPWNDYQIQICGEANNGLTALKLIKKLHPDIVISDIKMPIMDGLELFKEIKQENIEIKGIILTGYDDFEYAKKAINLNIIEYLLKPCKPEEILEAVLKAKNMVEQELSSKNILENYKVSYDKNLSQERRDFFRKLTLGKNINLKDIEKNMQPKKINEKNEKCFVTLIFSIDNKNKIIDYKIIEAIKSNIITLGKKSFINEIIVECFENSDDIIFIISFDNITNKFNFILSDINYIKDEVGISLTIGIGSLESDIKDINHSYNLAMHALEAKFFLGNNRVINIEGISPYSDTVGLYPINEEIDIINCLNTGNREVIPQRVENFYSMICRDKRPSKGFLQKITISFYSKIYKFCIDKNINARDIFDSNLKVFDKIEDYETLIELKTYVCFILNNVIDKIKEGNKKNIVITMAVEYIMKNYNKGISLEIVSKELYISTGYLSLLFKQEMKVNFIDFISDYRIEKSKDLLKNTLLKNYQVAKQVGFNDEKYFSQLFKKHTGATPTQYRQNIC